jgi:hypothetical protein
MMLAVAARENLEQRQFDIRTAFLNGHLEEEVYLRPPHGFDHLAGGTGRVLGLRHALYGLRQVSRAWNKCLEHELRKLHFARSDTDPALWSRNGKHGGSLTMFYVDDGLLVARSVAEADSIVDMVAKLFPIHNLGEPSDMLGLEVERDRRAGEISI